MPKHQSPHLTPHRERTLTRVHNLPRIRLVEDLVEKDIAVRVPKHQARPYGYAEAKDVQTCHLQLSLKVVREQ